jgi:hypothetical protein
LADVVLFRAECASNIIGKERKDRPGSSTLTLTLQSTFFFGLEMFRWAILRFTMHATMSPVCSSVVTRILSEAEPVSDG